jgi:branched-chain amino acid aminotransferase
LTLELPQELASAASLTQTLGKLMASSQQPATSSHRLRLQLWRGGGGLYAPETTACNWLATSRAFQPNDAPIATAGFAETVRTRFSSVSFCKGPESLTYVLAARERAQRGVEELFLLDAAGHVAESVAAAVFWLRNGQLFTPALETGCVAGVRRAHLLAVVRQHHLGCREGLFQPADLLEADAVFTANVTGIRALHQLGEVQWQTTSPFLVQLQSWEAGH